jgi:shikimate dehydrogenase
MNSVDVFPNASTRTFAVLGHPVSHSLSPAMHNPALREMGINAVYLAYDVLPEDLPGLLPAMARMGFAGCNLTIPHKEIAFREIEDLADTARVAGSVNTVVFKPDGGLQGHSTDGYGLCKAIEDAIGYGLSDRRVMVLGCGGAGRAAAVQAALDGATLITLANRTLEKAEKLSVELRKRFPSVAVSISPVWPPKPDEVLEHELLLQSTSMGMTAGEEALLGAEHFRPGQFLLDMTYTQKMTPIIREAQTGGARAVNGLGMLLHQGVRSLEIWTGQTAPVACMRQALQQHIYGEVSL